MPDWDNNNPLFPGGELPDVPCYDDWGNPQSCDSSFFDDMSNPGETVIITEDPSTRGFYSRGDDLDGSDNNPILLLIGSYLAYSFLF